MIKYEFLLFLYIDMNVYNDECMNFITKKLINKNQIHDNKILKTKINIVFFGFYRVGAISFIIFDAHNPAFPSLHLNFSVLSLFVIDHSLPSGST